MMKGFANFHVKKGVIRCYAEPFPLHYYLYGRHASRAGKNKPIKIHNNVFIFSAISNFELRKIASGIGLEELKEAMVGERIRREP